MLKQWRGGASMGAEQGGNWWSGVPDIGVGSRAQVVTFRRQNPPVRDGEKSQVLMKPEGW